MTGQECVSNQRVACARVLFVGGCAQGVQSCVVSVLLVALYHAWAPSLIPRPLIRVDSRSFHESTTLQSLLQWLIVQFAGHRSSSTSLNIESNLATEPQ